jgi:4a-hydroxytetrahydrobiopterin dehydratase
MSELSRKTCTPCRGGIPPLAPEEARRLLQSVPEWSLSEDARTIARRFRFRDFSSAMQFAVRVGELAEEERHHPDIKFGWGYCDVSFRTHKIKGLHENDFIMAAKLDALLPASGMVETAR